MGKENAIRGRLGALRMSVTKFAELMGISRNRAYAIVDGVRTYKSTEIEKACNILNIPSEDIPKYFFGTLKGSEAEENEREEVNGYA